MPSHPSYVTIIIYLSFQYTSKRILLCPHYRWETEALVCLAVYSLRLIGKNLDCYLALSLEDFLHKLLGIYCFGKDGKKIFKTMAVKMNPRQGLEAYDAGVV